MADVPMTLALPSGETVEIEMPDDVPIGDLIPDFVSELRLPTTGSDGAAVVYRIHAKGLARELESSETVAASGVPHGSVLLIAPFAVAGAAATASMTGAAATASRAAV
jgi:hypothetical protein